MCSFDPPNLPQKLKISSKVIGTSSIVTSTIVATTTPPSRTAAVTLRYLYCLHAPRPQSTCQAIVAVLVRVITCCISLMSVMSCSSQVHAADVSPKRSPEGMAHAYLLALLRTHTIAARGAPNWCIKVLAYFTSERGPLIHQLSVNDIGGVTRHLRTELHSCASCSPATTVTAGSSLIGRISLGDTDTGTDVTNLFTISTNPVVFVGPDPQPITVYITSTPGEPFLSCIHVIQHILCAVRPSIICTVLSSLHITVILFLIVRDCLRSKLLQLTCTAHTKQDCRYDSWSIVHLNATSH